MKPEPSPREELEARLTALLLGELPPEEAASLRQTLAQDVELARLHDRLKQAIELVRQAGASPEQEQERERPASGEAPKLSADRRARLLATFKVVRPKELAKRRTVNWGEWAALAAMIMGLLGVAAILFPPQLASTRFERASLAKEPLRENLHLWFAGESLSTDKAANVEVDSKPEREVTKLNASAPGRADLLTPLPGVTPLAESSLRREQDLDSTRTVTTEFFDAPARKAEALETKERALVLKTSGGGGGQGIGGGMSGVPPAAAPPNQPLGLASPAPRANEQNAIAANEARMARRTDASQKPESINASSPSSALNGTIRREGDLSDFGAIALTPAAPQLILPTQKVPDVALADGRVAGHAAGVRGPDALGVDRYFKGGLEGGAADGFYQYDVSGVTEIGKKRALGEGTKPGLAAVDPTTGLPVEVRFAKDEKAPPVQTDSVLAFALSDLPGQKQPEPEKPALESLERRKSQLAIVLPKMLEGEEAEKREPQIRTGPVAGTEIKLYAEEKSVRDLAKVAVLVASVQDQETAIPLAKEKAGKGVTADDRLIRQLVRTAQPAPEPQPELGAARNPFVTRWPTNALTLLPQPEVSAAENPFSTFSLNVSDVSFQLAAASLEKGQMPDPATVRSEEFINAFDYRDPEPKGVAPIAFAWERARYPFAHNRDLIRFSIKTAASGRQPGRPLNLVLLLDNSGSMERADRVRIIQECLRVLAGQLQAQDRVSVVAFARTPRLWVDGLPGNQAAELPERVGSLTPQGGTNLEDAMNLGYQTALRHYFAQGVNRVVLLTDGAANLGDVQPESLKKKVEAHRRQGIALDCFGIGWEGFNDELLETLSRNGDGRYGFVNTPEAASTDFAAQLAGALQVAASDVKVQVEFNPRRATAYRQLGYAKHQLTKEQFRDNTVDGAEIGAAEAGNALYVVELNPAGEGPIGTVRVRFKVPGTSDYHEHEWPVPYEGAARPLEQASAALRLAASASAFSEWLVSSPHAAEVTPERLLGYLNGVPELYAADPRPKKLEWMIRQAKSVAGK